MKHSYFISDLHLSETRPELTALFVDFMQQLAPQAERVYILGDLFDFWIGDDEQSPCIEQVKNCIQSLTAQGVKCYFQHGNRDFLLGERFAKETGIQLLPDYQVIDLYNKKILLCHGDTLCIDDVAYQQFRYKVHQKWRQRLFLWLPLKVRVKIAEKIRAKSNQDKQGKPLEIMDVNPAFTAQKIQEYGVALLIHGHTHREAIHHEKGFTRIVLGDWRQNYASILRIDESGQIGFISQH